MRDMTARMDFFMPRELAQLVAEVARRRGLPNPGEGRKGEANNGRRRKYPT